MKKSSSERERERDKRTKDHQDIGFNGRRRANSDKQQRQSEESLTRVGGLVLKALIEEEGEGLLEMNKKG